MSPLRMFCLSSGFDESCTPGRAVYERCMRLEVAWGRATQHVTAFKTCDLDVEEQDADLGAVGPAAVALVLGDQGLLDLHRSPCPVEVGLHV